MGIFIFSSSGFLNPDTIKLLIEHEETRTSILHFFSLSGQHFQTKLMFLKHVECLGGVILPSLAYITEFPRASSSVMHSDSHSRGGEICLVFLLSSSVNSLAHVWPSSLVWETAESLNIPQTFQPLVSVNLTVKRCESFIHSYSIQAATQCISWGFVDDKIG